MSKEQGVCCMDCTKRETCEYTTTPRRSECHDCWLEGEPLETDMWKCGEKMPCDGFIKDEVTEVE
jgi:hypothetical protein